MDSFHHKFHFKHPFTLFLAGPTQSGKTHLTLKLLNNLNTIIQPSPNNIVWAYGERDTAQMAKIQNATSLPIEFVEGLPDVSDFSPTQNTLLILDDLMHDAGKSKSLSDIFTKGSSHRNVSVIFIVQNIFHQGKAMRDISLNCKYMILFKNPRDSGQIQHLSRQIYPKQPQFLPDAFEQATIRPHGYLLLDFSQQTQPNHRVVTGIFPNEVFIGYIPRKK